MPLNEFASIHAKSFVNLPSKLTTSTDAKLYLLKEEWMVYENTVNTSFVAVEEANGFNSVPNFDLYTKRKFS